ncbi:hypothetical protein QTP88_021500 [Uroleucon formosanum]
MTGGAINYGRTCLSKGVFFISKQNEVENSGVSLRILGGRTPIDNRLDAGRLSQDAVEQIGPQFLERFRNIPGACVRSIQISVFSKKKKEKKPADTDTVPGFPLGEDCRGEGPCATSRHTALPYAQLSSAQISPRAICSSGIARLIIASIAHFIAFDNEWSYDGGGIGKREEWRDVCPWTGWTGKVNSVERPKNMSPAAARCSPRVPLLLLLKSYFAVLNGLKKAWSANKLSKNNNNDDKIKIKNLDFILFQKYFTTLEVCPSKDTI